jgi:hypothetical protein
MKMLPLFPDEYDPKVHYPLALAIDQWVVPTRTVDSFNTLYTHTCFHFQTIHRDVMWAKEFGVN